jgi:[histone H3]-N6,N6-dimethyl-lysine9 N-methyltransferase
MPIPCVNYFDESQPPPCIYSTQRIPTENVALNLDTDFMVGCDCKDDCSDKSKCGCWQLTVGGATYGNPHIEKDYVGYTNKRLLDPVITGIYECNPRYIAIFF